jgi:hypothetical protein
VLDDLACVVEAEDVDAGVVRPIGPALETVEATWSPSAMARLNSTCLPGHSRAIRSK